LLYRFLLFYFPLCPVLEKAKDHQRAVVWHFCVVRDEPWCIASITHCKHSCQVGLDHPGRCDLNVLHWTTNIPDRKPVLSIERPKIINSRNSLSPLAGRNDRINTNLDCQPAGFPSQ
jgi:hypothetical protein